MTRHMEEHLNLPELPEEETEHSLEKYDVDDLDYVKENIKDLISSGMSSLEVLTKLAKSVENPRAFEAVSTLIKTLLEANKEYHTILDKKSDDGSDKNDKNDNKKSIHLNADDLVKLANEKPKDD